MDDERKDVEGSAVPSNTSKPKDTQTVFRKVMDPDNDKKLTREEVEMQSPALLTLFLDNTRHLSPRLREREKVTIWSPFEEFIWNWDMLTKACEPVESDFPEVKQAREDLAQILAIIKSSSFEAYFLSRESNLAARTISFEYVWTLFTPGTMVFARPFLSELQMFEVQHVSLPKLAAYDERSTYKIWLRGYDWDGTSFQKYTYEVFIKKFDGMRGIDSLACFPVAYYRAPPQSTDCGWREKLLSRARRYLEMYVPPAEFLAESHTDEPLPGVARKGKIFSST